MTGPNSTGRTVAPGLAHIDPTLAGGSRGSTRIDLLTEWPLMETSISFGAPQP